MAVHPAGDGVSWTTDVDADQPHGLDYRYTNHVAKGVASRINKEHKTFADATAGGEHLAGGCNILLLDTTANMVADGTIIAGGLACASSGARAGLYFFNDATVAQNVPVTNASMCLGDDFSWAGHHEFDSTVNFFKAVDMSTVTMDGSLVQTGSSDMSAISSDGTVTFLDEVDISTLNVSGNVAILGQTDGSVFVASGDCSFGAQISLSSQNVYDSGFFDSTKTGTYTKTHDLSSTAININLFFKDVGDSLGLGVNRIYVVGFDPDDIKDGGIITNITTTALTVQAGGDNVMTTYDTNGGTVACITGQYRVIATRLL